MWWSVANPLSKSKQWFFWEDDDKEEGWEYIATKNSMVLGGEEREWENRSEKKKEWLG